MANAHSIAHATPLPDDPSALKALIGKLMGRVDALELSNQELELKSLRLEMQLFKYKKWMYGPRADKLASLSQVDQMLLGFGLELDARPIDPRDRADATTADQDVAKSDAAAGASPDIGRRIKRARGRGGRRNLGAEAFAKLPVRRREYDLSDEQKLCPCCGKLRVKIGEDATWQIEHVPAHFERLEHIRFKYACSHCEHGASPDGPQIERAEKPDAVIDKGLAGPGLLAYVVTSKFADYLPLYRLEDIFERSGFTIARPTLSLWCRDVAELVTPLYELMIERVLRSRVVGTDDTIMPMLDPGAGKTKKARMWVYGGDEGHPYNIFDFTLSRSRDGPSEFLKDYTGTLIADAYGGYDGIVVGNQIRRAGCWAHARRKFVDAQASHPAIAASAVGIIGTLYAIEERGKMLSAEARGQLRRAESAPILAALKDKLFTWRDQLLPKHPMAQAVGYALNQWNELSVFAGGAGGPGEQLDAASFGRVPIDNNASEREMKRIVLNRKNSLFVGNPRGGRTAAILSSLTSTCRRHDIDPQRYLTQLLMNLPGTPVSQLERWLPDEWKRRDAPPPE